MKIECPNCKHSGEVPDSKIPVSGMTATCQKCKTKFSVLNKKEEINNDTDFFKFYCPKCNFLQPVSDVCIKCGVIFSKHQDVKHNNNIKSNKRFHLDINKLNVDFKKHPIITALIIIIPLSLIGNIIMATSHSKLDNNTNNKVTNNDSSQENKMVTDKTEKPGYLKSRKQYMACTEAIKDQLKSPTTAKFPSYGDINGKTIFLEKYGIVNYYFYVDSQNSFGAMIRTNCKCIVNANTDAIIGATADE